jgi:hypothetical protein
MPGTLLRIAVSITVAPTSASTVREVPLESVNVIFGNFYPLIPAQAGIHSSFTSEYSALGPRLRGDER